MPSFAALSKIKHDFSNKVVLKLKLQKNYFNIKCAPEFLFFLEKKFRMIQMIFYLKNSFWMSNFDTFWQGRKAT